MKKKLVGAVRSVINQRQLERVNRGCAFRCFQDGLYFCGRLKFNVESKEGWGRWGWKSKLSTLTLTILGSWFPYIPS